MEARFAGSQRVGDRRRRRLAVGADDNADNPNADGTIRPNELAAPAGSFRAADSGHTEGPSLEPLAGLYLPVARIIPVAGWKYLAGGLVGLAISAAIVIAGYFAPVIETFAGPGISDLLALPNGRLAQWFSGLLLLLCSQLSLVVWWARSRSLEDFEGRYWLWIRTAAVWLFCSGCVSIEAHNAVLKTLLYLRPDLSREHANLCWMVPAAMLGVLLVGALVREMRGCRASRAILLVACACQLLTAGLHLELESFLSSVARVILVQAGLLTGHVLLFVSMWLHARHVLHCTAEPAPHVRRTWRIPRPHFGFSGWRPLQAWRNRKNAVELRAPHEGPKSRRKRPAAEAAAQIATQAQTEAVPGDSTAPVAERLAKPRIRFDVRHLERSQQAVVDEESLDQIDARSGQESSEEETPAAMRPRNFGNARSVPAGQTADDTTDGAVEPDEPDDSQENGYSKPELRGLSKKQRRRLMQELRDRERESKR
jgi:hypothetical protein